MIASSPRLAGMPAEVAKDMALAVPAPGSREPSPAVSAVPASIPSAERIKHKTTDVGGDHIAIIGPYGNVWADQTFPTAEAAETYLRDFWKEYGDIDLSKWRLASATVKIRAHEPAFPLPSAASAIEARQGGNGVAGAVEDESAVAKPDAKVQP